MMRYSGFVIVMGGLFLVTAMVFLVLTYITKYPTLTILGIAAVVLFIQWLNKELENHAKEILLKIKQKDSKNECEFDAWMKSNGDD